MYLQDIAITTSDCLSYRKPSSALDPLQAVALPVFMTRHAKNCAFRTPQKATPPPLPEVTPRVVAKDHCAHTRYVSYEKARRRLSCRKASEAAQAGFRQFLKGSPYSEKYAHSRFPEAKLPDDLQSLTRSANMFQHMSVAVRKKTAVRVVRVTAREKSPRFFVQNSGRATAGEEQRQVRLVRKTNQRNQPVQVNFSVAELT